MKKHYLVLLFTCVSMALLNAQTPFGRVYATLNAKCQNSTCHSSTATDASAALKFDDSQAAVYSAIFEQVSSYPASQAKFEKLIKAQHPYSSFLLRKIAGADFDTNLAIDTATEGQRMLDISGQPLTNIEIEYIRQWIRYGAQQAYSNGEPQPNYQIIHDYYTDTANSYGFLPKPPKPDPSEGLQLRMGPVFLPPSGAAEQEWLQIQEVNFPYPAAVDKIDGYMNQQSHHFLLFKFTDSTKTYQEVNNNRSKNLSLVSITGGNTSFDGDKILTAAWQDDGEIDLPQGTAIFWDQKTYLDMNYHVKNYSTTGILPCDFYFNVYFKPRTPDIIEMKANLVNNAFLFLTQGVRTVDYDDESNNDAPTIKYVWNMTSHAHKYGIDYDIYVRDTFGVITDKLYEGFEDYSSGTPINIGYYSWDHPSTRYWPNLQPVYFGKRNGNSSGLVARTTYDVTQPFVTFGFTTNDEMQLFYYMYTEEDPFATTSTNDDKAEKLSWQVLPNPMNSNNGLLMYTLNNPARVRANIVDVTGKTIARLTEENQTEGVHQISLGNNSLASGIYFATISIDGTVYTKKFIVTE